MSILGKKAFSLYLAIICIVFVSCSGGEGGNTQPSAPPPQVDIWAGVKAAVNAAPVANIHLIVGTGEGEVFTYEKGNFPRTETHRLASASKLLSGITIMRLVEQGTLSLDDHPQDYIPWWTHDINDSRSQITLENLLSFTSGFNYKPGQGGCVNDGSISLEACAREYYDGGIASAPGDVYYYGPAHLQVAAYMAEVASGIAYVDLFKTQVADILNLGSNTGFVTPSLSNPRASAGAQSTAADYSEILRALLAGELISNMNAFAQDRIPNAVIGHRPVQIENQNMDWHYGLGFWRECEAAVWDDNCANNIIVSSPGAFGWNPWVDLEGGYYGLIAMDVSLFTDNGTVELKLALRPLVETALVQR